MIHLEEAGEDNQKRARAAMTLSAVDEGLVATIAFHIETSEQANHVLETHNFVFLVGHFEIIPALKMEEGYFTLCNNVITLLGQLLHV